MYEILTYLLTHTLMDFMENTTKSLKDGDIRGNFRFVIDCSGFTFRQYTLSVVTESNRPVVFHAEHFLLRWILSMLNNTLRSYPLIFPGLTPRKESYGPTSPDDHPNHWSLFILLGLMTSSNPIMTFSLSLLLSSPTISDWFEIPKRIPWDK